MSNLSLEETLNEIVTRILLVVHPRKIILFGSAVRGVMGPNSDLDLLVIVPSSEHQRRISQKIYRNLIGVGFAADIVVVTEKNVERYKNNIGMIIKPALEQGRVLYVHWQEFSFLTLNSIDNCQLSIVN